MKNLTCNICCDSVSKVVKCTHCDHEACKDCVRKYIEMDTSSIHATCMSCRKTWNREYLIDNLPKSWLEESFKKKQENCMLDREKSMLPMTQQYVQRELAARAARELMKDLKKRKEELVREMNEVNLRIEEAKNVLYGRIDNHHRLRPQSSQPSVVIRGACPKEACKGFLGEDWKCPLCDSKVCKDCRMEICGGGEEHACKKEDVESAKFLAKDAKPCPNCTALCHKVDGCSQVFCVNCKTAFNYKTLQIETTYIHAPDYYRWVRENGRELARAPGDVPCHGDVGVHLLVLRQHFNTLKIKNEIKTIFMDIHRLMNHVRVVERVHYRVDVVEDNVDIRVKYMLNELEEDKWKKLLQQRNKAREKKQEIYAVLDTFVTVCSDLFRQVIRVKGEAELPGLHDEFCNLRTYINDRLLKISKIFSCMVPQIDTTWATLQMTKGF